MHWTQKSKQTHCHILKRKKKKNTTKKKQMTAAVKLEGKRWDLLGRWSKTEEEEKTQVGDIFRIY